MSGQLEDRLLSFIEGRSEQSFETLARELYGFQREHNPIYNRYCARIGAPGEPASWKRIPALPQQAFKQGEVVSFPAASAQVEFRTSGTTGEGYGRHLMSSVNLYEASVRVGWRHLRLPADGLWLLMPSPADAPHSSLSRMGAILTDNQPGPFLVAGNGRMDARRLERAVSEATGPLVIFGTALAFMNLLDQQPGRPLALPSGSSLVETGGFKGSGREIVKRDLYGRLSTFFQVEVEDVWNEYGMTELSSQCYARGVNGLHDGPPWLRFLIIDPYTNQEAAPGTVGMLRIFDLANRWSVLGIQTQDLAVQESTGGFRLLGRDPAALPRGCSRALDELLQLARP
jgi:hypothetical protein